MLILKMAWRNVWRHKGKSVIIGMILFLGAWLMMVGNALNTGAKQSLQENLVKSLTGELILMNGQEDAESLFFMGEVPFLKLLPEYPKLKELIEAHAVVERALPMAGGNVMLLNADPGRAALEGEGSGMTVYGVEFEDYQTIFNNNVVAIEGSLLQNGERGMLLTEKNRQEMYDRYGIWVIPQSAPLVEEHLPPAARAMKDRLRVEDNLVLLGVSGESLESDIRVPVKGIVRLRNLNTIWRSSFIDIEFFRACFGYVNAGTAAPLTEEQTALLDMNNEQALFAGDNLVEELQVEAKHYDVAAMQQQTQRTDAPLETDAEAYQMIMIRLKPGVSQAEAATQLRRALAEAQMNVKVLTWQQAAGSVTQFAALTQGVLFVFVLFIFFVAAIVIMNTLSMAAFERTSEIGMMRAIGARKNVVGSMFVTEIAILSVIFGGIGMLAGAVAAWGLAALQIPMTAHDMLNTFAGGDILHPIVGLGGFLFGSAQLAAVTILAALYPMWIARNITPLEAITRD